MDFSVDPCKDFYKFSCGKWPQINPLPSPSTQVRNILDDPKHLCGFYITLYNVDQVDTGQFETLRLLCLSPELGGFYKNGEGQCFCNSDTPPLLTYFMARHTTLHTTFLNLQPILILACSANSAKSTPFKT